MAKDRKINFIIGAKNATKKVFKSIATGLNKMKKLGIAAGKTFALGFGIGVIAVGGLVAGLGRLITRVTETQDAIGKTADKLGLTTEALTGLHLAAEQTGIATNTIDMGLQRMTRRLSEAAKGTGEAKDAIKELGLDASKLNKMTPDQALLKITEALEGVENQADKVRLAFKIFDSEGVSLLNLTTDGIKKAREEAEAFGTSLGRDSVSKMESFNDNLGLMWESLKGFTTQLVSKVVPVLDLFFGKLVAIAKEGGLAEWGRRIGDSIAESMPKIIEFVRVAVVGFVRIIPQALIFMIDIIGKVALAFAGWKLIWNGLKQAWAAYEILVVEGLKKILQIILIVMRVQNIGGIFDDQIASARGAIKDMDSVINSLDGELNNAVKEQKDLLNATDAHQRKIKEYEQSIKGMEGAFDSFADSMSNSMKKAADESITQIERVEEKAKTMSKQSFGNLNANSADLDEMRESMKQYERQGG